MKRLTHVLAPLAIWLGFLSVAHAGDGAIRSAQMFTRGGEWATVAPHGEEAERAEIEDHFAAVLGRLRHDTPYSLRIAEARLERAFGLTLTPGQRAEFLDGLALRREIQLDRLAAYTDARQIYRVDGLYTPQIRNSLQQLIDLNRSSHPASPF